MAVAVGRSGPPDVDARLDPAGRGSGSALVSTSDQILRAAPLPGRRSPKARARPIRDACPVRSTPSGRRPPVECAAPVRRSSPEKSGGGTPSRVASPLQPGVASSRWSWATQPPGIEWGATAGAPALRSGRSTPCAAGSTGWSAIISRRDSRRPVRRHAGAGSRERRSELDRAPRPRRDRGSRCSQPWSAGDSSLAPAAGAPPSGGGRSGRASRVAPGCRAAGRGTIGAFACETVATYGPSTVIARPTAGIRIPQPSGTDGYAAPGVQDPRRANRVAGATAWRGRRRAGRRSARSVTSSYAALTQDVQPFMMPLSAATPRGAVRPGHDAGRRSRRSRQLRASGRAAAGRGRPSVTRAYWSGPAPDDPDVRANGGREHRATSCRSSSGRASSTPIFYARHVPPSDEAAVHSPPRRSTAAVALLLATAAWSPLVRARITSTPRGTGWTAHGPCAPIRRRASPRRRGSPPGRRGPRPRPGAARSRAG